VRSILQCYNEAATIRFSGERIMLRQIGPVELIIVLAIILLLFGVGRVSRVGKELGTAISEFRKGLADNKDETPKDGPEN
jgi:sec-independent protein translocase protein TatA